MTVHDKIQPVERQMFIQYQVTEAFKESPFGNLPDELMLHIFGYLSNRDRVNLSYVCRDFRRLAYDNTLSNVRAETRLCTEIFRFLLKEESQELQYAVELRRIDLESGQNKRTALGRRAKFLQKLLIDRTPLCKLAKLDLEKLDKKNQAKQIRLFLEKAIIKRWKTIIHKTSTPDGTFTLHWYLRFSNWSFNTLLKALREMPETRILKINLDMTTEYAEQLGTEFANNSIGIRELILEPASHWTRHVYQRIFNSLAHNRTLQQLSLIDTGMVDHEIQYLAQSLSGGSNL